MSGHRLNTSTFRTVYFSFWLLFLTLFIQATGVNAFSLCSFSNKPPLSTLELHFPASLTPVGVKRGAATLLAPSSIPYAGGRGCTPPSHLSIAERRKQHMEERKMSVACYRKSLGLVCLHDVSKTRWRVRARSQGTTFFVVHSHHLLSFSPGTSMWVLISRQSFLHASRPVRGHRRGHQRRNPPGNSCSGSRGTSWRRVPTYKTKVPTACHNTALLQLQPKTFWVEQLGVIISQKISVNSQFFIIRTNKFKGQSHSDLIEDECNISVCL